MIEAKNVMYWEKTGVRKSVIWAGAGWRKLCLFMHPHLLSKYSSSTCCVPGMALGPIGSKVNKTDTNPQPFGTYVLVVRVSKS